MGLLFEEEKKEVTANRKGIGISRTRKSQHLIEYEKAKQSENSRLEEIPSEYRKSLKEYRDRTLN